MGLLAAYRPPEWEKVTEALKDPQGFWTGVYWHPVILGYNTKNTKMVSSADVPKKWEDLLNPRWKEQIGLMKSDVDWYMAILHLMGEEKGKDFMRRIAKQEPQIRAGHTLLAQLVAAGEIPITPTMRLHDAEQMKAKGAPVDWTAIEPMVPPLPTSVSLTKSAPHPNAGKVFIDFILSKEGQTIIYELKRNPIRMDVEQPVARAAKLKLMKMDYSPVAKNYSRYEEEFRDIFGIR